MKSIALLAGVGIILFTAPCVGQMKTSSLNDVAELINRWHAGEIEGKNLKKEFRKLGNIELEATAKNFQWQPGSPASRNVDDRPQWVNQNGNWVYSDGGVAVTFSATPTYFNIELFRSEAVKVADLMTNNPGDIYAAHVRIPDAAGLRWAKKTGMPVNRIFAEDDGPTVRISGKISIVEGTAQNSNFFKIGSINLLNGRVATVIIEKPKVELVEKE